MNIRFCNSGKGRGFSEYIPGESAWRAVNASGYMVIHCIWSVGKSRGSGFAQELLRFCEEDTKKHGRDGVAMVTSESNWLIPSRFLSGQGYECVDQAPPSFKLMVKKFHPAPSPTFCGDWEKKQKALGFGLTLVRTDQCPYLETVAATSQSTAESLGVSFQDITLQSAAEIREKAPCAYGTNALLYNGKLLTYTWISKAKLMEMRSK